MPLSKKIMNLKGFHISIICIISNLLNLAIGCAWKFDLFHIDLLADGFQLIIKNCRNRCSCKSRQLICFCRFRTLYQERCVCITSTNASYFSCIYLTVTYCNDKSAVSTKSLRKEMISFI